MFCVNLKLINKMVKQTKKIQQPSGLEKCFTEDIEL